MTDTIIIPKRRMERGNTAAALTALNEVLLAREWCIETDTRKVKVGDGVTAWNALPYVGELANLGNPPGDRLVYWDDAAGQFAFLALGTGLTIGSGGDLDASGGGGGGQASIQFKDEGSDIGAPGAITAVDFVGSGISAAVVGTVLTVTASGGGGGGGACLGNAYAQSATLRSVTGSNFPFDNTIPQNTEGVALTDYDLTYTPTNASSILEIEFTMGWVSANGALQMTLGCFVDSVADALFATNQQFDSAGQNRQFSVRFRVAAGSTAARTYKWRWGSTGTSYLNQGNATAFFGGAILSTHTVKEFTP